MKRCVCGKSKTLPLCDGAHRAKGWRCSARDPRYLFAATPALSNLAEALAHHLDGALLTSGTPETQRAHTLVWLSDGQDTDTLFARREHAQVQQTIVLAIDVAPHLLTALGTDVRAVTDPDLIAGAIAALSGAPTAVQSPYQRVFLSHAIQDEAQLFGAIHPLRQLGLDVFVCADSIPAGTAWHAAIEHQLTESDVVLFLASKAAARSTFCAFEIGMATGLNKPVRAVLLDDTIPGFIGSFYAVSVSRLQARKPWLSRDGALLDAMLVALGG